MEQKTRIWTGGTARMQSALLWLLLLCVIASGVTGDKNCVPGGSADHPQRVAYACENSILHIQCGSGELIRVCRANYGRFSITVCNQFGITHGWNTQCMSLDSNRIVSERCDGHHTCTVPASNKLFGEPCPNTAKYIEVMYYCQPVTIPTLQPPTKKPNKTITTSTLKTLSPTEHEVSTSSSVTEAGPEIVTSQSPSTPKPEKTRPTQPSFSTSRPKTTTPKSKVSPRYCLGTTASGIQWPVAASGQVVEMPCPPYKSGTAKWRCAGKKWAGRPDLSGCVSPWVDMIDRMIDVNESLETAADHLFKETSRPMDVGDLKRTATKLMPRINAVLKHQMSQVQSKQEKQKKARVVVKSVTQTASNLLSIEQSEGWQELPSSEQRQLATTLVDNMEQIAFDVASTLEVEESVTSVDTNIAMEVNVVSRSSSDQADLKFPSASVLSDPSWKDSSDKVVLPRQSLVHSTTSSKIEVVFLVYSNLEKWLSPKTTLVEDDSDEEDDSSGSESSADEDGETGTGYDEVGNTPSTGNGTIQDKIVVNSKIFSVSLNRRQERMRLMKPMLFTLKHTDEEISAAVPVCSFWDYDKSNMNGLWSGMGCRMVDTNVTHTTCECDHLTNFAVLMDVTGTKLSKHHELALQAITYVGCTVSIICLAISFMVFTLLKNLQCDRNTIHKNLVVCLAIAELIFLVGIGRTQDKIGCAIVAGLLHFFFLASFAWMCLEGVQLYVMLVEVFEAERSPVKWYYLGGYGVPAIVVAISAAVNHTGYGTDRHCWLSTENHFIWSFVGPVAAVITVNIVMLSIAIYMMCKHGGTVANSKSSNKTSFDRMKAWIKGAVVLVVLLGLTWVFGFLYLDEQSVVMAYLFAILNSLQGLFIFIFHCLLNEKVKKELKKAVQRASWLPDCVRVSLGGYTANLSHSPNQSSTSGNYFIRFLSGRRRKRSSASSTLVKSSSPRSNNRRSELESFMSDSSTSNQPSGNGSLRYSNLSDKPLTGYVYTNGHVPLETCCENDGIAGDLSIMDCSVIDSEFVSEYCHHNLQASMDTDQPNSSDDEEHNITIESIDKNRLSALSEDSALKNHSNFVSSEVVDMSYSELSEEEDSKHKRLSQEPLVVKTESERNLLNRLLSAMSLTNSAQNLPNRKKSFPSTGELNKNADNIRLKMNLSTPNLIYKPGPPKSVPKPKVTHDSILQSLPNLSGIMEDEEDTLQISSRSTEQLRPVRINSRSKLMRLSSDAEVKFDPHRFDLSSSSEC